MTNAGFRMREYIGITFFEDAAGTHVMTAYHGTDMMDSQPDQTVIWSSRIDFPP